jgi:phosphatidylglycerophosphate synthase
MKQVADWLTASRAVIALWIVSLGWAGKRALPVVILLLILGWTTDILDGRLARRAAREGSPSPDIKESSWLGEHDFTFDMIMVFASFVYLTASGYVPAQWALGYTVVAAIFILASSGSKSVTELFAFPLVALPLIIAYQDVPWAAYLYLAWILLALILAWERFTGVVREFIEGMRRLRKI